MMLDYERVGHIYIIPEKEASDTFEFALAISEKHQGKGLGKATVQLGLEEGKKLGYKKMIVSIREDNIASLKAFASCGVVVNDKYHSVFIPKLNKNVKMFYAEKDLI